MKKQLKYNSIRPLPYYMCENTREEFALAKALRREFLPKIATRLKAHHLNGFKHDFIVKFVAKHKKTHPCFLKTDISAFYPSIRHQDLVVGCQIAYRDLLSMQYVPQAFKKKYVAAMQSWCNSLPLTRGIPLGSPLSAILAPIMLVALWLHIKRQFGVPFVVYMDDVLIMTTDTAQAHEILAYIENELAFQYDLKLNLQKTCSGRFSRNTVEFCGWRFAGGYTTISEAKIDAFKQRIHHFCANAKQKGTQAFIKQINRKIDGFGHYYKFGHVRKQFEQLDIEVRGEVRKWLTNQPGTRSYSNNVLRNMGLRSLEEIHERVHAVTSKQALTAIAPTTLYVGKQLPLTTERGINNRQIEIAEHALKQLTESVRIQRKMVRMMSDLLSGL